MPTPKKLKKEENKLEEEEEEEEFSENESMTDDDSEEDDDEDVEDDEEVDENEEIMIDFEARSIEESDMESVKLLVQQKLGVFSLNVHETAKIIVQQDSIGNVIFQSAPETEEDENMEASNSNDDSTIFGVLSLIDLNSSRCQKYSTELKSFIIKESQKFDKKNNKNLTSQLNNLFKEKKVCFVVNERFVNIPPAISVPMFESLINDLEQIKSNENNFTSDYWLFLSKRFQQDETESSSESSLIYSNPEEEVFEQFSEIKFEISYGKQTPKGTSGKWSSKDPQLSSITNCLIVPFDKIKDCLDKIKTLL